MLRHHRDVIFDIKMKADTQYTIEADMSEFYNPRDKKIVPVRQKVSFVDGERFHLYLGREFGGHLILKANGKFIHTYHIRDIDRKRYGSDPAIKPAPFIVMMHAPTSPQPVAAPTDAEQVMRVIEIKKPNYVEQKNAPPTPPEILKFFMDGGEATDLDPNKIITQNWIIGQLAGSQAYLIDNRAWAKELMGTKFRLERVMHKSGPAIYMIFNQRAGLRTLMNAARYSLANTKIIKITAGAANAKQTWGAARGAMNDSIKIFAKEEGKIVIKGGGIAVLFTMAMDTAEWYKDYSQIDANGKHKKDFTDLFSKIGVDVVKAGLSAAIASAVVAGLLSAAIFVAGFFGATVVAPVALLVVGTLAVAIFVGYRLDLADKKIAASLGEEDLTAYLSKKSQAITQYLGEKFSKEALYKDYHEMFVPSGQTSVVTAK
ncbi:hypothetical protein [Sulfuriferula thiophila]|uniref:hypothetical protein n=1 Tax=Sulfuriferula thiophila TaxID=1781211 RepID=UPI000F60757E|nr:hypothetical protein [Sulfuriferula thiophila]